MLAIGRALVLNPKLLLLDEPTEGLAPIIVKELLQALRRIFAEEGMSAIVIEQHAKKILELTDDAIVLERGAHRPCEIAAARCSMSRRGWSAIWASPPEAAPTLAARLNTHHKEQTSCQRTKPPFRADMVGSLLRTQPLKEAREKHAAGQISAGELEEVEDGEIAKLVKKQEEIGLQAVTDGEYRRAFWHFDFLENLTGWTASRGDTGIQFKGGISYHQGACASPASSTSPAIRSSSTSNI